MTRIKNLQTIIQDYIDFIKAAQPEADVKPATVIRDIFIDAPATQLSAYYDNLGLISNQLSLDDMSGTELESYISGFGISKKRASASTGIALLTFNSLVADIGIPSGSLIYANNGVTFQVMNGVTVSSKNVNFYRSVALKYKNDLDFLGITDQYAVEVTIQCNSTGTVGNIAKYGINRTNVLNINNATNIYPFSNGVDIEVDSAYKNRFKSILNGASSGTSLGYSSAAQSVTGVSDALVIEPGDPLMVRDGTQVLIHDDGTREIISEGSGSKVDVLILGKSLQENIESFIYKDKSNTKDPTSSINDYVLGQIPDINGKTINRKRFQAKQTGLLPYQPISDILEVTGSSSGANFTEKSVDEFGVVTGNYEIIKDTGNYAGSPFASDKFHWISNKITNFFEDKIKGQLSGQDKVNFTDVIKFSKITQNIAIKNENSTVLSSNKYIQLLHTPAQNVSRVFNVSNGEQYIVVNQNPDGGLTNTTGKVEISGKTLPRSTDILQVDYNWVYDFDPFYDFDGKVNTTNQRDVVDSIDWGYGTLTIEKIRLTKDISGNFYSGFASNIINSILDINSYESGRGTTSVVSSGLYKNRIAFDASYLSTKVTSVSSIFSSQELWNTTANDGVILTSLEIDGYHHLKAILPTDVLISGQTATVFANKTSYIANSTSNGNIVTIPSGDFVSDEIILEVIYFAKASELTSDNMSSLPLFKSGNTFTSLAGLPQSQVNKSFIRESCKILQNFSMQYYIDINLSQDDAIFDESQIIGIWDISTNQRLDAGATVAINGSMYRIMISNSTSPVLNNNVIVIYNPIFKVDSQPTMFKTEVSYSTLSGVSEFNGYYKIDLSSLIVDDPSVTFDILDYFTKDVLHSYSGNILSGVIYDIDGYINGYDANNILVNVLSGSNKGLYNAQPAVNGYSLVANINSDATIIRLKDNKDLSNNIVSESSSSILFEKTGLDIADKVILLLSKTDKIRCVPTKLNINLIDQNINTGVLQVLGDSCLKLEGIFTATSNGLKQNISELLRANNLTGYSIIRVAYLAKVQTSSFNSDNVLYVKNEYDLKSHQVKNTLYSTKNELKNNSLLTTEFQLQSIPSNTLNNGETILVPQIGDRLKIVVYLLKENDYEILSFVRPGVLYTSKSFMTIKSVKILSGFKSTVNSRLVISGFNQPSINSRYRVYYDYIAPKQNERISIRYNYNKLVNDVTSAVEKIRLINADVLVKEAKELLINASLSVVILPGFESTANTIVQNLKDALINSLNFSTLGGTIDSSDIINTAYSISGIDRVRIIGFNKDGQTGQVLSITAQKDEYFVANNVVVTIESR